MVWNQLTSCRCHSLSSNVKSELCLLTVLILSSNSCTESVCLVSSVFVKCWSWKFLIAIWKKCYTAHPFSSSVLVVDLHIMGLALPLSKLSRSSTKYTDVLFYRVIADKKWPMSDVNVFQIWEAELAGWSCFVTTALAKAFSTTYLLGSAHRL